MAASVRISVCTQGSRSLLRDGEHVVQLTPSRQFFPEFSEALQLVRRASKPSVLNGHPGIIKHLTAKSVGDPNDRFVMSIKRLGFSQPLSRGSQLALGNELLSLRDNILEVSHAIICLPPHLLGILIVLARSLQDLATRNQRAAFDPALGGLEPIASGLFLSSLFRSHRVDVFTEFRDFLFFDPAGLRPVEVHEGLCEPIRTEVVPSPFDETIGERREHGCAAPMLPDVRGGRESVRLVQTIVAQRILCGSESDE
jgi:hypothetical protein